MKSKKSPMRNLLTILLVIAATVFLFRHFHIEDFYIIKPGVLYTSSQPRGMDYTRLLYRYHIATIVNTRPLSEHQDENWHNEEITWTRSNGVNYREIPIEKNHYFPDKQTQEQFLTIMADNRNLPVFLHGGSDDKRVAMLVAVWLEQDQRYTVEQAIKAVKMIIDDRELTRDEIEFISALVK